MSYHPCVAAISREEVVRLSRLARLELTDDEVELFTRQLGDILEFARQVNAVDTTPIDTTSLSPGHHSVDRLRDDRRRESLDRDAVLDLAPEADRAAGLFIVPRVLIE